MSVVSSATHERVGFDVGRVIVEFLQGKPVQEAEKTYLEVPPNPGAFEVIGESVDRYGPADNYIISRCGDRVRAMIVQWLNYHDFYRITGFKTQEHLHFTYLCEEKGALADGLEGGPLTRFVDDSMTVLTHMNVRHKILFGPQPQEFILPDDVAWACDWMAARQPLGLV